MIRNNQPVSMAECLEYIKKEDSETTGFIKKFTDLSLKNAREMREKINGLGLIKIKNSHVSKIIDLLPENAVDLNKIFEDISLDENETNKILEIVKQYN